MFTQGDWLAGVAKKKKKKALKIKVGKTTGSRVVFDEEGHAVEPLAQLALPESNECATHPFTRHSLCNKMNAAILPHTLAVEFHTCNHPACALR